MLLAEDDYAKAEPLYRQALDIRPMDLALLYLSMGEYAKAEPLFKQALTITLKHLNRTAVVQSQRQQLRTTSDVRHRLDSYLSFTLHSNGSHESVYRQLLIWKGIVLLRQRVMRAVADQPELNADLAELDRVTRLFARLALRTPTPEQLQSWQK